MYGDAMQAIHENLLTTSVHKNLTYTAELIPERRGQGDLSVMLPHTFQACHSYYFYLSVRGGCRPNKITSSASWVAH